MCAVVFTYNRMCWWRRINDEVLRLPDKRKNYGRLLAINPRRGRRNNQTIADAVLQWNQCSSASLDWMDSLVFLNVDIQMCFLIFKCNRISYQFVLRRRWRSRAVDVGEKDGYSGERYPVGESGLCKGQRRPVCDSHGTQWADTFRQVLTLFAQYNWSGQSD